MFENFYTFFLKFKFYLFRISPLSPEKTFKAMEVFWWRPIYNQGVGRLNGYRPTYMLFPPHVGSWKMPGLSWPIMTNLILRTTPLPPTISLTSWPRDLKEFQWLWCHNSQGHGNLPLTQWDHILDGYSGNNQKVLQSRDCVYKPKHAWLTPHLTVW